MTETISTVVLLTITGLGLVGLGFCLSELRTIKESQDFLDRMGKWGDAEAEKYRQDSMSEKNFSRMDRNLVYRNGLLDGLSHRISKQYQYKDDLP